jgi:hypothetical protein
MKNIVGRTRQSDKPVVILASHYDTRLMTNAVFVGANDGGSSTGLLLELARVLSQRQNPFAVWFVFFDGGEHHWRQPRTRAWRSGMTRSCDGDGTHTRARERSFEVEDGLPQVHKPLSRCRL